METMNYEDTLLDLRFNDIANDIRKKHKLLYEFIYKYNQLAYKIWDSFVMDSSQEILYLCTTYNQMHNSFQSFILLLERGVYDDAHIIFRSMYDKFINFMFVIKDIKNYRFIEQDFIQNSLKLLNGIRKKKLFRLIDKNTLDNEITKFRKSILHDENGRYIPTLSMKEKADKCGMQEEYIHYRLLSEYTHNNLKSVYENITIKDDGVILESGIKFDNFIDEIILSLECFKNVMHAICDYLKKYELKKELENLNIQFANFIMNVYDEKKSK